MQAIREIIKIKNHKIQLNKKIPFNTDKAEIIILPHDKESKQNHNKLSAFFSESPLAKAPIEIIRSNDTGRNITL